MQRAVIYAITGISYGLMQQYLHGYADTTEVMLFGLVCAYLCDKAKRLNNLRQEIACI